MRRGLRRAGGASMAGSGVCARRAAEEGESTSSPGEYTTFDYRAIDVPLVASFPASFGLGVFIFYFSVNCKALRVLITIWVRAVQCVVPLDPPPRAVSSFL